MNLLIFGLGYTASHFAARYGERFAKITGTFRSTAPHEKLPDLPGVTRLSYDGLAGSPAVEAAIAEATHILTSIAPDDDGDPVLRHFGSALRQAPKLQWIGYLSTVGVYGDAGGAWIDETAPTIPPHTRGAARVDAELAWQALGRQRRIPVAILRLGGIYGPGQNAFVRLVAGRAHRIDKPGHVSNRIHVADIAQAIDAAFSRRFDGIVNVTDCEPAPPGDQIEFAAKLLGVAPPPLLSLDEAKRTLSPFLMSFYDGCARVRNDKLKNVLGVKLRYPDYRAGLQALRDDGFAAPPEI